MRSKEVTRDMIERIAAEKGLAIELPGPDGGWARLTIPGERPLIAWVPAVAA